MSERNDVWFDESIELKTHARRLIGDTILQELISREHQPRERSMGSVKLAEFTSACECLIANFLLLERSISDKAITYRRSDGLTKAERARFSPRVRNKVADHLSACGYSEQVIGRPADDFTHGKATTIKATPQIVEKLEALNLSVADVALSDRPTPLATLKTCTGRREALKETPKTTALIAPVRAYNEFLREFDVSLPIDTEGPLAYSQAPLRGLVRSFLPGMTHGRLYRGAWQNLTPPLRNKILINGEETIEADYSGSTIRIIYHCNGIPFEGDPYAIPGLIDREALYAAGLNRQSIRAAIKRLHQKLLNTERRENAIKFGKDRPTMFDVVTPARAREIIEEFHEPIKHQFYQPMKTEQALRVESDICLEILSRLREQKILALPIHDSFVFKKSDKSAALRAMMECYYKRMGFYPVIK